ncbi:MAG: site-specific integrase [Lamprobacter sp.]|uniref:site-specific integrase n=1 Tax=Lamprobacter sp. TaxID=3100796 RepID=UPI002B2596DA|nr:site-specific integrase [Lamprobacter sp.]MEA3641876.1 site-specific integrase [Lamprobacter sp.]
MATKRKRGGTWHYVIRRSGLLERPIYLSFGDETEGDAYIRRLEGLLDRGIVPQELVRPSAPAATLLGIIRGYLGEIRASADDRRILERWLIEDRLPDVPATGLDYDWALGRVAADQAAQLAPSTIRHRTGALARCLDWAVRREHLISNPLRLLPRGYAGYGDGERQDQERDRRLSAEEEAAVRRVLAGGYVPEGKQRALRLEHREAHLLLFELALETAMRLSEIYTLESKQVDLGGRTIYLDRTKNGDKRQVPLSSVALVALGDWIGVDRCGLLLPFFDGNRRKTTARLSHIWSRVFEHAGCPDVRWHDLRHEATCRLYERTTLSDLQISRITGHRSLAMLRRYANLRGSDLADRLW